MELPQAEPPRCRQPPWMSITEGVSRMHSPADRELLKDVCGGCVPDGPVLQCDLTVLCTRHYSVTRGEAYGSDLQSGTCGYYLRRLSEDAGLLHPGAGPHRHRRGPGAGELLPQ